VTGQASGGQTLTPNPNVNAPAGLGGDLWGANGGGITAIGNGVTGQTGWDERVAPAQNRGLTAGNYEVSPIPVNAKGAPTQSVKTQESNGALSELSLDDALPSGGSNQG
jgi:hypothetical protein